MVAGIGTDFRSKDNDGTGNITIIMVLTVPNSYSIIKMSWLRLMRPHVHKHEFCQKARVQRNVGDRHEQQM